MNKWTLLILMVAGFGLLFVWFISAVRKECGQDRMSLKLTKKK